MQNIKNEGAFDSTLRSQLNQNFSELGSALSLGPAAGTIYWVDTNKGNDGSDGLSPSTAFRTMSRAFAKIASGDTIRVRGKVREQLTTPAQVFDVTIIGDGTRPRHADSTPNGGQNATATWAAPATPTAATPLVKVIQQGWRFVNLLFAGPTDAACVLLYRDGGLADAERDASHASFVGCRFASGYDGISDTGGCFNVKIVDCIFSALTNFAILGVGNIGVGQSNWVIEKNHFADFTNGVKIAGFACRITGNFFEDGGTPNTTVVLNVSNGGGGRNFVVENWFQGTTANFNSPDVVGNATDVWFNHALDTQAAGVNGVYEVGQPA